MNIFEYAIKMEKDDENYYRELMGYTENKGIQSILKMLADQEANHYEILMKMSKEADADYIFTDVLDDVKNVFETLKAEKIPVNFNIPQKEFYEKARDIEENSYEFYLQKSREVENPKHQKVFAVLAEEEKQHMFLMENFVDFVGRPDTWIENAEFTKLEEY